MKRLRVCRVGNSLYYSDGHSGLHEALSTTDLLRNISLDDYQSIDLLGSPNLAPVICSLYKLFENEEKDSCPEIRLGSPVLVGHHVGPADLLMAMSTLNKIPASCGGWHLITAAEYKTYVFQLAVNKETNGMISGNFATDHETPALNMALQAHPVWPYVTFLKLNNLVALTSVLSSIADPRWFVDPEHPNRPGRLHGFLGLQERSFASIVDGSLDRLSSVSKSVVVSWWSEELAADTTSVENDPKYFLFRFARKYKSKARGLLRGSNKLIELIRQSWIASVTSGYEKRFLAPEILFVGEPATIQAFGEHIAKSALPSGS